MGSVLSYRVIVTILLYSYSNARGSSSTLSNPLLLKSVSATILTDTQKTLFIFLFVICSHCFIFTLSFKGSDIYTIVSKHTPQKNPKAVGTIPSHRVQISQSIDKAPFSPQSVAYMDSTRVSLALQRRKAFKASGQCRPRRNSIGQLFF